LRLRSFKAAVSVDVEKRQTKQQSASARAFTVNQLASGVQLLRQEIEGNRQLQNTGKDVH